MGAVVAGKVLAETAFICRIYVKRVMRAMVRTT